MKTNLKLEAQVLRRRGYSFAMLSERLGISKSTASVWTRDVEMSPLGVERLSVHNERSRRKSADISHGKRLVRIDDAVAEARQRLRRIVIDKNISLIILSILYESEGAKGNKGLSFANSDSGVIRLFMKVLRSCFDIDESRLHCLVHIHDYHDDYEIKKYWSQITGINISQFNKSFIKKSKHIYKKDNYKGCLHVKYHDFHVSRVIQAFAKELIKLYI